MAAFFAVTVAVATATRTSCCIARVVGFLPLARIPLGASMINPLCAEEDLGGRLAALRLGSSMDHVKPHRLHLRYTFCAVFVLSVISVV